MFLNNINSFSNLFDSIVYRRDLMLRDFFSFSFSFFLSDSSRFEFFNFSIHNKDGFYIKFN